MGEMVEQFGAVPVRASRDTRLRAADFRLLVTIAYFDRFGRNGTGCFVDHRRLAEDAAIDYKHISRHTSRLAEYGYIEITRGAVDQRRRVYHVIYHEDSEDVAKDCSSSENALNVTEKVANVGDNMAKKVTNANPEPVDHNLRSAPKRSCKTDIKKIRAPVIENSQIPSGGRRSKAEMARQGDRAAQPLVRQSNRIMPMNGHNHKKTAKMEIDWKSWARWLESECGIEDGWRYLMGAINRVKAEHSVTDQEAWPIIDTELRKLRARRRDEENQGSPPPDLLRRRTLSGGA